MKTKISFVGGGNIARAICAGLVKRGGFEICAAEIDDGNRRRLKSAFGDAIAVVARARDLPQNPAAFVLAIKPQDAEAACADLTPTAGATVVSVAAGIRIAALSRWLGGRGKIARAMPNTPALVGCGMTFCCAPDLDAKARALTTRIFKASGSGRMARRRIAARLRDSGFGQRPGLCFLSARSGRERGGANGNGRENGARGVRANLARRGANGRRKRRDAARFAAGGDIKRRHDRSRHCGIKKSAISPRRWRRRCKNAPAARAK